MRKDKSQSGSQNEHGETDGRKKKERRRCDQTQPDGGDGEVQSDQPSDFYPRNQAGANTVVQDGAKEGTQAISKTWNSW